MNENLVVVSNIKLKMSILKIFRRQSVQTHIPSPNRKYYFWNKKIEYEEKHNIALGNSP